MEYYFLISTALGLLGLYALWNTIFGDDQCPL